MYRRIAVGLILCLKQTKHSRPLKSQKAAVLVDQNY